MKKNKNFWNILSNYGNKLWGIVSVFMFIPLYINYLGIESFAVIGFYSLLLGIISFADSGLSSAVIKEFSTEQENDYKYSVLRIIEKYYFYICFLLGILIFVFAPYIAKYWLTSESITVIDLSYYLRLIGVGIVIQLISSLYNGALFGLDFQVKANFYQFIWSFSKSLGCVVVLILVDKTLEVFFVWQIICNIIYVISLRFQVLNQLKKQTNKLKIVLDKIPPSLVAYISGMFFIAVISAVNTQADKIVTSYIFPLKVYGYYTITSTFSQVPLMIGMPLAISVFPIFSKLVSSSEDLRLSSVFDKFTFILYNLVIIVGVLFFLNTKEILLLWTKDAIDKIYLPDILITSKFLIVGSIFLSLQLLLYFVLLAFGKTKYNIIQGIFQVVIGLPILYLAVFKLGIIGAGISWVVINFGGLVFLFIIVSNSYIKFNKLKYLLNNVIIPLIITTSVSTFFFFLGGYFMINFIITMTISSFISLLFNLIYYNIRKGENYFNYSNLISIN